MNLGLSSIMIVDRRSAILGVDYRQERVQYLNANHRDVCKFDNSDDPNYLTVKNALATVIQDLLRDVFLSRQEHCRAQLRVLQTFLGVADRPDNHYQKVEGSCRWIDHREDFLDWREPASTLPSDRLPSHPALFMVSANPGTGKTVLASHVIAQLQEFQLECAYYFFHHGNEEAQSVAALLRSLAYQMASSNAAARERLVGLHSDGVTFDKDDARTLWMKLFKNGIFHAGVLGVQYWVIDALDECVNYQELFTMLKGESPGFPLRIFITSRKISDAHRLLRFYEESCTFIEIPLANTLEDIKSYIQSRTEQLPLENNDERLDLAEQILAKSRASFLWVSLVLDELERVYGYESILDVLEGIPEGMLPYYDRVISTMSKNNREKHIAKAILVWSVASSRPITVPELTQALKLDINTHLLSTRSAIGGLCGQLVSVDERTGTVQVIHATVREFLLSDAAGEFKVSRPLAHERMALACLKLLLSEEMRPPRHRRFMHSKRPEESTFLTYASTHFGDHIYAASSESDDLLLALNRFARTNSLTWIERLALKRDLSYLIRTAKNLRAYLDRRAKLIPPLSRQARTVESWSIDLSRLVVKFSTAILSSPPSIFFFIPPLCPTESFLHRQFGKTPDGLSLVGSRKAAWDDCIATIPLDDDIASSVACGEGLMAVGMESGNINLYNDRSYQKECVIYHKEPLDLLCFDPAGEWIAASSSRWLGLWRLNGELLWESRLRHRCILLTSFANELVGVSHNGHVQKWDISSGALLEDRHYLYRAFEEGPKIKSTFPKTPTVAAISSDHEILALGYGNACVCVWSLLDSDFVGWAYEDKGRDPFEIIFNPNPNVGLFLVCYTDCHIAVCDSWSGSLVIAHEEEEKPRNIGILSVACSPDGRTVATMDLTSSMRLFDFETLVLLYHVTLPSSCFRILKFSSDGTSIVDVMDSQVKVWSPVVLIRKAVDEDMSISEDMAPCPVIERQYETPRSSSILATASHPSLPVVVAGKHDGQVVAYNARNGQQLGVLYAHSRSAFITCLAITQNNIVASGDVNGHVQVWKLDTKPPAKVKVKCLLFEIHTAMPAKQLLFTPLSDYLMVSTEYLDQVFSMGNGECTGSLKQPQRKLWRWLIQPAHDQSGPHFVLVSNHQLSFFTVAEFPDLARSNRIDLNYELGEEIVERKIMAAVIHPPTRTLILDIRLHHGYAMVPSLLLFSLGQSEGLEALKPSPLTPFVSSAARQFISMDSSSTARLIFMDNSSWISSLDLNSPQSQGYIRHFFVPNEYGATLENGEIPPVKTADDAFAFALNGELSIIKNGLKFQQTTSFN